MFNIFYALKWRQKELKHLLLINLSYILNTQTNFKKTLYLPLLFSLSFAAITIKYIPTKDFFSYNI